MLGQARGLSDADGGEHACVADLHVEVCTLHALLGDAGLVGGIAVHLEAVVACGQCAEECLADVAVVEGAVATPCLHELGDDDLGAVLLGVDVLCTLVALIAAADVDVPVVGVLELEVGVEDDVGGVVGVLLVVVVGGVAHHVGYPSALDLSCHSAHCVVVGVAGGVLLAVGGFCYDGFVVGAAVRSGHDALIDVVVGKVEEFIEEFVAGLYVGDGSVYLLNHGDALVDVGVVDDGLSLGRHSLNEVLCSCGEICVLVLGQFVELVNHRLDGLGIHFSVDAEVLHLEVVEDNPVAGCLAVDTHCEVAGLRHDDLHVVGVVGF